jgi:myo-inositol-1(or 4)-monophosphatase
VRELVTELALGLREHLLPQLGSHAGRAHVQAGVGGDVTFAIDEQAELFLEQFLAERAPDVAFYSEDRGLVEPSGQAASQVLVVDPIDGTRPAMAGFEGCCVSVAAAPLGSDGAPTMGDVELGCIVELKTGTSFLAERGAGVEIRALDGAGLEPNLSANTDTSRLFWTLGFRGRPAVPLATVLSELIDGSSVGGAVFDLGSATYDMTRIVTGQLDAYVDVGTRMIDEVPAVRAEFERVGGGAVLNNSPYDLAAAVLCVSEAGGAVSDAYGRSLTGKPLLGSGHEFQMSCLAAANEAIHAELVANVGRGIVALKSRYAGAD